MLNIRVHKILFLLLLFIIAAAIAWLFYDHGRIPKAGERRVTCADVSYAEAQKYPWLDRDGDGEKCDKK